MRAGPWSARGHAAVTAAVSDGAAPRPISALGARALRVDRVAKRRSRLAWRHRDGGAGHALPGAGGAALAGRRCGAETFPNPAPATVSPRASASSMAVNTAPMTRSASVFETCARVATWLLSSDRFMCVPHWGAGGQRPCVWSVPSFQVAASFGAWQRMWGKTGLGGRPGSGDVRPR